MYTIPLFSHQHFKKKGNLKYFLWRDDDKLPRVAWGNNPDVFREGRSRFFKFDIFETILKYYQVFCFWNRYVYSVLFENQQLSETLRCLLQFHDKKVDRVASINSILQHGKSIT